MKPFVLVPLAILFASSAWAADKAVLELQRDMALMQDEMKNLEQRVAAMQTAIQQIAQQTSDLAARSDARLEKLQGAMDQSIKSQVSQLAAPIAGMGSKLDSVGGEVSALHDASGELARQMTSMRSQLDEINTALKAVQSTAPPPTAAAENQQVPPTKMFNDATADMNGKQDLALIEFSDFLRLFPTDPLAPRAQFNVGQIHYGQGQFDQAVQDFDAMLTKSPDSPQAPDAMLMKGLSLIKAGKRTDAIQVLRALVMKYTQSSQASQARDLLRALVSSNR